MESQKDLVEIQHTETDPLCERLIFECLIKLKQMIHSLFNGLSKFNFWKSSFPGLLLQLLLPFAGFFRSRFCTGWASSKLSSNPNALHWMEAASGTFCDQEHSGNPVFIQFVEVMQTA